MSDELVMIDTNVISEATKSEPRKDWGEWIDAHPRLAIPFPVWSEIQLGISSLTTNPKKRAELEDWLADLRASEYFAPPMNEEVALLYGEMMACKPLNHLWMTVPSKNKIKVKSDLLIAAIAIVHSLPFATYDIVDFGRIDSYFKMLKLIYPGVPPLMLPDPDDVKSCRVQKTRELQIGSYCWPSDRDEPERSPPTQKLCEGQHRNDGNGARIINHRVSNHVWQIIPAKF